MDSEKSQNEKLTRCVANTKHKNKLRKISYRSNSQCTYLHPSWHTSISHCRAFVKRAISCTTESFWSMLGTGAKRSVLCRYGCGQHRQILWLYEQTSHLWTVLWIMQEITEKSGPLAFSLQRFDLALCATTPCPKTTSQVVALDRYVSDMSGKWAHTEQTHGLCSSCNIKSPLSNSVTCHYAVWRISCRAC